MNEIAPISTPGEQFPRHVAPPSVEFSTPCDQLIGALAQAQLQIIPPRRSKHVEVHSRRTGGTYSYDYAPLEAILAAVTRPLAAQGLILTQVIKGSSAVSILLMHASGQWMGTDVPLMKREEGYPFQDFSGALTAARRVGIQALLSISAEDDDDGNANAGHDIRDRHWDPEIEAEQQALHPLGRLARSATSVRHGCDLLEAWAARALEMGKLRRSDAPRWGDIVKDVSKGLNTTLGTAIAAAWRGTLLAETSEQHAAVRAKWDGDWNPVLEQFRDAEPHAFGLLVRHLNERRSEIEAAERAASTQAGTAIETPADTTAERLANEGRSARDLAIEAQQAPGDGFVRVVFDAFGDAATDEFTSPEAWARAFASIREKTAPEERDALDNHNMDAISDANAAIGAEIILREAFEADAHAAPGGDGDGEEAVAEPVAIPVVERPTSRNGSLDIAAYVARLAEVIATLQTADEIARFIEVNSPHYTSEGTAMVVQIRVLKAIAARKRALGIPLPSEG